MRTLIIILLSLSIFSANSQGKITLIIGSRNTSSLVNNAIIADNPSDIKGYNAFGYPFQLSGGSVINGFKRSDNHASQGDFAISVSSDGGATTTIHYVKYSGSIVQTSQGSFFYDPVAHYIYALNIDANTSGNTVHFYKVETYRISESTFVSTPDADWEKTNTVDFTSYATNMVIGDLWGDCLKMPSGKILVPIHLKSTTDARNIALFIQSTDNGGSWSIGNVILDKVGGGSFPNGSFSEVNPTISEVGATDATTKIVVLLRDESYGYWTHVKSSDGGTTWSEDVTNAFGYNFDNFGGVCAHGSPAFIPITSRLHNDGYVYSVIGYRGYTAPSNHASVVVLKMLASDFYNNTYNPASASTSFIVQEANCYINTTNNDLIHFGYPMFLEALDGSLWVHYYDEHNPSSDWLGGNIKTRLIQTKIVN